MKSFFVKGLIVLTSRIEVLYRKPFARTQGALASRFMVIFLKRFQQLVLDWYA